MSAPANKNQLNQRRHASLLTSKSTIASGDDNSTLQTNQKQVAQQKPTMLSSLSKSFKASLTSTPYFFKKIFFNLFKQAMNRQKQYYQLLTQSIQFLGSIQLNNTNRTFGR